MTKGDVIAVLSAFVDVGIIGLQLQTGKSLGHGVEEGLVDRRKHPGPYWFWIGVQSFVFLGFLTFYLLRKFG